MNEGFFLKCSQHNFTEHCLSNIRERCSIILLSRFCNAASKQSQIWIIHHWNILALPSRKRAFYLSCWKCSSRSLSHKQAMKQWSPVSACINYSYSLWLVAIKGSCVLLFDYAAYSAESEHVSPHIQRQEIMFCIKKIYSIYIQKDEIIMSIPV